MVRMIDRRLHLRLVLEGGKPGGLRRTDDEMSDQDIVDPGRGHDLGLGDLGHGDADRAGLAEQVRDRRALERLRMRPPAHLPGSEVIGHLPDVEVQVVEVEPERGGVQVFESQANRAELHGLSLR